MSSPKEPTLEITRIFDAPRDIVFEAWTSPQQVMKWWGPTSFTSPSCKIDFRPGGQFQFCMRAPDGKDFWNAGFYKEIQAPERIVSTMTFADADGNPVPPSYYGLPEGFPSEWLDTVTFEVYGANQTRLTLKRSTPLSVAKRIMEDKGWSQSMDRLEQVARQISDTSSRELITLRLFDAPRDLVWEAFVNPEHLVHWWGPKGFTNTFRTHDLRPGGVWEFTMHGPNGVDYPNRVVFIEVVKPDRLVWDHGSTAAESAHFRSFIHFDARGEQTHLTMRTLLPSAAARDAVKGFAVEGARQTMDRLEEQLKKMRTKA